MLVASPYVLAWDNGWFTQCKLLKQNFKLETKYVSNRKWQDNVVYCELRGKISSFSPLWDYNMLTNHNQQM
jgi:hypothetical protein